MSRVLISSLIASGLVLSACAQETSIPEKAPIMTEIPTAAEISVQETHQLRAADAVTLIDVRRPNEWKETGVAAGAIGATLQDDDFLDQILAAVGGDKSKPVALICRSGGRSAKAQKQLKAAGYTTVINVAGGTLDWIKQDLPLDSYEAQ